MKKWLAIPALVGVVAIGGVAMAANVEKGAVPASKDLLTIEEAKAIAVKSVDGKVTKIELEQKKTGTVYEVEIQSKGVEYDLDIDAKTGKVLATEKDDDDDDKDEQEIIPEGNYITEDAATAIAMKQAKGTVSKIKLDNEDGRVIYEIEITDDTHEYDFDIDARSGEVLKFEKERNDE
ncbi:PepSY domain-containing protein [Sporosarcina limicola]|uniref:Membrane protein YkoI n=1 Tax=Sporosarcina limicola TaxID=34101 RepID=A0A927R4T8_9BACL|nr:PepSY domain-containing protein [Sporosarcina limicola]MBE1555258.1 putative membrane protein YkoI [Sporosarcina limicola]